jgi:cell division protein FtsZ
MSGAGSALMGIGSSRGDDRAVAAAEMAISSPLLEASIDGAHGVLLSIQGGSDLGLFEINEAAQLVSNSAAVDANIIFGAVIDDALGDEVRVTVIAAGFDEQRPGRSATSVSVPLLGSGRASAAGGGSSPGYATASATGAGSTSPATGGGNGHGASNGAQPASASAAWGGNGSAAAGQGASGPQDQAAGTNGASVAGQPASGASAAGNGAGAAGGGTGQAAEAGGSSGYVPAPVSFVSPDEDAGHGAKPGPGGDPREARDPGADAGPAWKDSGRAAKQDKVFDVNAGRRRPVVFEEEDDLDVPDFLK